MRTSFLIAALALGACARVESVNVSEDEVLNSLETPVEPAASAGSAGTPGGDGSRWFARTEASGRWAGYGVPFSETTFSARCEGGKLIFNTTEMPPTGAGSTTMSVSGQRIDENLSAQASEDGLPNTEASVDANAQWLERLAAATGNLTVQVGGSDPMVVPIGEPLTSLVRDCMSGNAGGSAPDAAPAAEPQPEPAPPPATGN